ncbi:ankyrin repeat-containing domain protein [Ustulina deusta]|nr:ankyrin repeat-containing domain protein [Ustulina deusta]
MEKIPVEIHYMIAAQCKPAELVAMSSSCRWLHRIYNQLLYERNVKYHGSSALRSICQYKEEKFSVAALNNAINARANLHRTFRKVVAHTLPRQYSWSRPGFDQIAYLHNLTSLHLAALTGLSDTVTLLLNNGVDANITAEPLGWTPLFFALSQGQDHTARRLIDRGSSLILESGTNALHIATAANLLDIMTHLIKDKGIDPNSEDRNGDTPLIYALTSPYTTERSISHLLALGAEANKPVFVSGKYWSPISIALKCQRWEFGKELLDNGADPKGTSGLPSLQPYATRSEIVHPLLVALFVKSPRNQRTRKKIIPRLLDEVDLNMEVLTPHGIGSLLSTLVYRKLGWETNLILSAGYVDVESRDHWGITPLERALSPSNGSLEVAAILLRHRARIPRRPVTEILRLISSICQTPHATTIKETLDCNKVLAPIFQLLFNHCASVNPKDRDNVMVDFLAGCPTWMVGVTKNMNGQRLTNDIVLERMKGQFEIGKTRPRKAAPGMQKWWMHKGIKRRFSDI